jgi:hypothetical protein
MFLLKIFSIHWYRWFESQEVWGCIFGPPCIRYRKTLTWHLEYAYATALVPARRPVRTYLKEIGKTLETDQHHCSTRAMYRQWNAPWTMYSCAVGNCVCTVYLVLPSGNTLGELAYNLSCVLRVWKVPINKCICHFTGDRVGRSFLSH